MHIHPNLEPLSRIRILAIVLGGPRDTPDLQNAIVRANAQDRTVMNAGCSYPTFCARPREMLALRTMHPWHQRPQS